MVLRIAFSPCYKQMPKKQLPEQQFPHGIPGGVQHPPLPLQKFPSNGDAGQSLSGSDPNGLIVHVPGLGQLHDRQMPRQG